MDIKDTLLLNTTGNLYWKDTSSVYLGCNLEFARLSGLAAPKDIIGKTDKDLFSDTLSEAGIAKLLEIDKVVIETGKEITTEEVGVNAQGEKSYFLTKKSPIKNESQVIIGVMGCSINITELKKTQFELEIAKEKAEFASKAKAAFLENMCHDFRTPFSGLLSIAQMLHGKEEDNKKRQLLGLIKDSAQILLNDLNEIFNYLEESSSIVFLEKQFCLSDVVNNTLQILLPAAEEKNITVTANQDKKLPQFLIGDKFRTRRVLENIVSNAIKFTAANGTVFFTLSLAKETDKEVIVKFTVQDTGIGIPKELCGDIFKPLTRLHPSYEGVYPGKGFGLSLVKKFLDDLSGEIHLESEPGKGSTFKVLIPYKKALLDGPEGN